MVKEIDMQTENKNYTIELPDEKIFHIESGMSYNIFLEKYYPSAIKKSSRS